MEDRYNGTYNMDYVMFLQSTMWSVSRYSF
jgi:hypothetical protein